MKQTVIAVVLLLSAVAFGQTTRTWDQSKYEEFSKGTAKGVAVRSDGTLALAPEIKQLVSTGSTFLWGAASNAQGDVFIAGGAPARVYRVTPDGKISVVLAPSELQVQAVTVDAAGTVYAATSPDGKVYRIERTAPSPAKSVKSAAAPEPGAAASASGQPSSKVELDPAYTSSVFYDPKAKYIWALAADRDGRLYVATGDRGEIHRVEKTGAGNVFFKSDEAHIRALAFDQNGNLIAGSDGSGLIYRINAKGEGFVLYSAPKKEITALAVDGPEIYAAAAGEKRAGGPSPISPVVSAPVQVAAAAGIQVAPAPPQIPLPGTGAVGSEVYRIDAEGAPKRLWSSRDELVYALAIRGNRLIAGSGNKGKLFEIDKNGDFADLGKVSANQVVAFAAAPSGSLYAATSNLGKVFLLQDSPQREGTYESDVFDAKIFSKWGRVESRMRGPIELQVRSGNVDNPDRNWSAWTKVDLANPQVLAPSSRFLQWKAILRAGNPAPVVESVRVNYASRNIAPEVEDVTVNVGNKFASQPRTVSEIMAATTLGAPRTDTSASVTPIRDRDYIAVRWTARDDNDDLLAYSVYYRGDNETRWKLLKDGIADRFYSFDSSLLPDGGYTIRVVATDAPAHTPGEALTAFKDGERFEVDNTPPVITQLASKFENGGLRVTFTATDATSIIRRAEYSIDAGDWQFVAPVGGLSDAKTENYDVTVPLPRGADAGNSASEAETTQPKTARKARQANGATVEHVVVVRTYDRFNNMGTSKVVVRPK